MLAILKRILVWTVMNVYFFLYVFWLPDVVYQQSKRVVSSKTDIYVFVMDGLCFLPPFICHNGMSSVSILLASLFNKLRIATGSL